MDKQNQRPWGFYEILSDKSDHKVKRITVDLGKRLSYQYHQKRNEHWFIVSGKAIVTLDGKPLHMKPGDSIDIPKGSLHRIHNPADTLLIFIEIQTGDYFGDDDIVRIEDDFDRTAKN